MHKKVIQALIILLSVPSVLFANLLFKTDFKVKHGVVASVVDLQPITICSGASIVIQGESTIFVPDSYSWEVLQGTNWINAPGVNSSANYQPTLLVNNTSTNILFSIRRKITIGTISGYDSFYDVTVQPSSPISNNSVTVPAITSFCSEGNPATITGSTPTGGNGTFSYQWQISTNNVTFTNIIDATAKDYTPPQLLATTYYRRIVSSGSCALAAPSNTVGFVILTVVANNLITSPATNSFCISGDPGLITGNTPTGGNGTYTYQWQSSTDNITFTDIAGASAKDYDPQAITSTTYYRRLTTSGSCSVPALSNIITITVLPFITNNSITAPAVSTFCVTGDPAAIFGSTPIGGDGTYSYQWQISVNNITFTNIPGATLKDYDPTSINVTTYYRRIATSGICKTPVISNVATINIQAIPATPVLSVLSPLSICPGNTASLSVNTEPGLTYNWYDSPAKTNLLYSGSIFATPVLTANTTYYVESSNGLCTSTSMASVQVNMAIQPVAPVVDNQATCSGTSATLNVNNPQPGLTYKWYETLTGGAAVATGNNFTTATLSANATYYVEATNTGGCTSTRTLVTVSVTPLPQITVQLTGACVGSSTTLTATANVPNATIKWYSNATGGSALFTGNTFTTPALNSNTNYYVDVTNNVTMCTSARQLVAVPLLQPLVAPNVMVDLTALSNGVNFKWNAVPGAKGYQVSVDNGQTYINPSSGSTGLTHTIMGMQPNQIAAILVRAVGNTDCELSPSASASVLVPVKNAVDVYVPNAFTPNGDGNNDQVHVHSESIKNLSFYVYSQWGELLFISKELSKGWDGTYKGTQEPPGVYIYNLKATLNNGEEVTKKGTITLLR